MISGKELEFFKKLAKKRKRDSGTFNDPEYINMFKGVVDKYSDTAHFVYELLQNADDALATEVEFKLLDDGLIFKHNGELRFTVSDPQTMEDDKKAGNYGSVNSITSIGCSTKSGRADGAVKIGKFGVGFKAVFQYTDVAYVYDENIWFKISDYVVPSLLDKDHEERRKNETLFYLPFDKKSISKEKAYEEILNRLQSLDNPILFLNTLRKLSWSAQKGEESGVYEKVVKEEYLHNDIHCEKISNVNNTESNLLWLFTKKVEVEKEWHPICVGFYLSSDGKKINTNVRPHIYSYFVTNETLDICIVTHAPFDLVDNRQQIKSGNTINTYLYNELAQLTGEALCELRDLGIKDKSYLLNDNILKIVPLDYSYSNVPKNVFYTFFKKYLKDTELFITPSKCYVSANGGYWVDKHIRKLLTPLQFYQLLLCNDFESEYIDEEEFKDDYKVKKYDYICTSIKYDEYNSEDSYLSSLDCNYFDIEDFAENLTLTFIKRQKEEWLLKFYKFLCSPDARSLIEVYDVNYSYRTSGILRGKEIIKLESGDFAAPFDEEGKQNVFYYSELLEGQYNLVNQRLLSEPDFASLLNKLEIQVPSESVVVEQNILQKYVAEDFTCTRKESKKDFKSIFKAYLMCSKEQEDTFIDNVNKKLKLFSKGAKKPQNISQIYSYSDDSIFYFGHTNDKVFDYEFYKIDHICFDEFVEKLNFRKTLIVYQEEWNGRLENYKRKEGLDLSNISGLYEHYNVSITDYYFDGFKSFCDGNITLESSIALWNLLDFAHSSYLTDYFEATVHYRPWQDNRYNYRQVIFKSRLHESLFNEKWLYNKDMILCQPAEISIDDLITLGYNVDNILVEVLDIKNSVEQELINQISDPVLKALCYAKNLIPLDVREKIESAETLDESLKILVSYLPKEIAEPEICNHVVDKEGSDDFKQPKQGNIDITDFGDDEVMEKRAPRTKSKPRARSLESLEEKYLEDLEKQTHAETLYETVENTEQYSALWFKSLLELEYMSSGETNYSNNNKGYKIIFNDLESSDEYRHLIILKNPSRSIPRSIEECENIDVTFIFKDLSSRSIRFEVASAQEYSLKLKCALINQDELQSIMKVKNQIQRIVLETNKPICLIEKLKNAFANLGLADDYSCLNNLPNKVSFIFGPPGTGKTTYLVKKHINEISVKRNLKRTLILCPTNKACDVILDKATKLLDPRSGYDKWLYRFVATGDENLESFVCNRDLDVNNIEKLCLISTIARFPYDGFRNAQLDEIEWDTIIIDEASMIPLAYIVYAIYKCPNAKFIIAGDPFQIEPIVSEPLWEGENIYTMVNLNDFNVPVTRPHQFDIIKLDTQYRSVPSVGIVYSEYAYNGLLKHNREESTQRELVIDNVDFKSINLVAFPVRNNDSLYESKRISTSNVHVHSAIFTFEFLKFIADQLNEDDKEWKIGVISPYKAESDIVYKLWTQKSSSYSNVNVQVGTVHGFQGDECDIIIALYNPPASGLVRNKFRTFVNRKNILNVAISRARDYLFLLYPDQKSPHFDDLIAIKQVGKIVNLNSQYRAAYTTEALENIIFGDSNYIENNTFITNHQLANVYTEPISKYEIRIDENSVDIQTQ